MYLHSERKSVHIETESTIEGLQARTSASRPIRFQQSSQQPNVIGLEALVRACSPSVVLSVPMCVLTKHDNIYCITESSKYMISIGRDKEKVNSSRSPIPNFLDKGNFDLF